MNVYDIILEENACLHHAQMITLFSVVYCPKHNMASWDYNIIEHKWYQLGRTVLRRLQTDRTKQDLRIFLQDYCESDDLSHKTILCKQVSGQTTKKPDEATFYRDEIRVSNAIVYESFAFLYRYTHARTRAHTHIHIHIYGRTSSRVDKSIDSEITRLTALAWVGSNTRRGSPCSVNSHSCFWFVSEGYFPERTGFSIVIICPEMKYNIYYESVFIWHFARQLKGILNYFSFIFYRRQWW